MKVVLLGCLGCGKENPQRRGESIMPTYEYQCENCANIFSIQLSMSEHEKGNITCPVCKEGRVIQQYSTFYAKTSKKS
jgi:putative FmdB family regulatory protein